MTGSKARKRIAFFMPRDWPLANLKAAEAIQTQFSDCDVDVIMIEPRLLERLDVLFINTPATLFHYGMDILKRNKHLKESFWRTPYIFQLTRRWAGRLLKRHEYWFSFQIQSLFDCSLEGIPHFVYTDHTHLANLNYSNFRKEKLYPSYWTDLEKEIYDHASRVFVRSSNIKRSLEAQYDQPADKVVCVYAGNNVETKSVSMSEERFRQRKILFVGIDWERKGGPTLVSAFKIAQARYPDATLTIVGSKPLIDEEGVTAVGKQPPEELDRYYREASIFCMPTTEEPFGIVFLEAMQAGLPVIGTTVGAIPDFIRPGRNGFLVQPGDVAGTAEALISLLESPSLCLEYGKASIEIVEEDYNWRTVAGKFKKNILAVLDNNQH